MEQARIVRLIRAEIAILEAIADLEDGALASDLRDCARRLAEHYGIIGVGR